METNMTKPGDTLMDEIFSKKKRINILNTLIRESISDFRSEPQKEPRTINFPTFKFTTKTGVPDTKDRVHFEKIARGIKGDTVKDKLTNLDRALYPRNGSTGQVGLDHLISSLMISDIMLGMVQNFNRSAAGFLFETFCAALFEGTSDGFGGINNVPDVAIQIIKGYEGELPLIPVSLKLRAPNSDLSGSFTNLLKYFNKERELFHLIGEKIVDKNSLKRVEFYAYRLTADPYHFGKDINNLDKLLMITREQEKQALPTVRDMQSRFLNNIWKEKELKGTKDEFKLEKTFRIPAKTWKNSSTYLGAIIIDEEFLARNTSRYLETFQTNVEEIFDTLKTLTESMSYYYTDAENKFEHGRQAREKSAHLKELVHEEITMEGK